MTVNEMSSQDKQTQNRVYLGEVVSDKMDKTIVVAVTRTFVHSKIGKVVRRTKRYKAHDQNNEAKIGNIVEVVECRPLSKTKHMMLNKIVSK